LTDRDEYFMNSVACVQKDFIRG